MIDVYNELIAKDSSLAFENNRYNKSKSRWFILNTPVPSRIDIPYKTSCPLEVFGTNVGVWVVAQRFERLQILWMIRSIGFN